MNTAHRAKTEVSLRSFAIKTTVFSHCRIFDFADGSFLVVHDNGRVEANAISA